MSADPYAVLGVSHDADEEAIRQAYRRLAKKYHPDLNPGDTTAAQKMNEVNAAYDQIKNPKAYQQQQYQQQAYQQTAYQYDPFRDYRTQNGSQQSDSQDPFRDFYQAWYGANGQNTTDNSEEGYHWTYRRTRRRGGLLFRILGIYFAIQILFTLLSGCGYRAYYPGYYNDFSSSEPSGYSSQWQPYSSEDRGSID